MKEGSKVPRRGNVPKREVLPDPNYNSVLVTKLINSIMLDGKKGVAQKVVYGAFEIVENKTGKNGLEGGIDERRIIGRDEPPLRRDRGKDQAIKIPDGFITNDAFFYGIAGDPILKT